MSTKIAADHLARGAVVYVRQSTMTQVQGNLESQKRQYALADAARAAGFVSVTVIDDDLGRSGSGLAARPGFQRLVAELCAGAVAPCSASRRRGWRAMGATGTIWSISVP
ncbi:MAG TPA: recombinase family protein [Candidatus Limnocylindria bacterium]